MKKAMISFTVLVVSVISCCAAAAYDDLAKLVKAKVSDEIIVAFINSTKADYALNSEQIVQLKTMGATDKVIVAAIQHKEETRAVEPAVEPSIAPSISPAAVYEEVPATGEWVYVDDSWCWQYPSGVVVNLGFQPSFGHGSYGYRYRRNAGYHYHGDYGYSPNRENSGSGHSNMRSGGQRLRR